MLARQKSVGEHPSLPAGSLDLPVEVVDKLKSRQGVAVDASVARTSKTQLYHRLSKHLYQMNLKRRRTYYPVPVIPHTPTSARWGIGEALRTCFESVPHLAPVLA